MSHPISRQALTAAVLVLGLLLPATAARATGTVPEEDDAQASQDPAVRRTAFIYQVGYSNIPKSSKRFNLWVPLPAKTDHQDVSDLVVQSPGGSFEAEKVHGNNIYHGSSGPRGGVPYNLNIQFTVKRREVRNVDLDRKTGVHHEPPPNLADYTESSELLPLDREVRSLANRIAGKSGTIPQKARAIYEWVVENIKLSHNGSEGWGEGDLKSVLSTRRGNSLDAATAFVGLARAAEIPSRTVIGFKLPEGSSRGILTGYHAWAEFWTPDHGWVPVDPALATESPSRRPYYFGSLDPHRIRISVGRNVDLQPQQAGAPLSYLLYPYAELDGEVHGGSAYRFSFDAAPPPPETASSNGGV